MSTQCLDWLKFEYYVSECIKINLKMGECDFSVECEEFLVDLESVDTVEEIVEPTGLAAPERQSDSAKYSD